MRILLAEDEFIVRTAMAEALKADGHDVWEAETGDEAILWPPYIFSDSVTDYYMPGAATGAHVAVVMRRKMPTVGVIIATGRPEIFRSHWASHLGYRLLPKPFTTAPCTQGGLTQDVVGAEVPSGRLSH